MVRTLLARIGLVLTGLLLFLVAALLWPPASAPLPARHASLLIDGARIIDVENGTAGDPTRVLVRGGRIAAIAPDLTAPPGAHRVDARGQWLMPGLWDMHSHSFKVSPQLHLPLQLASGVTAVRDMMGCPERTDPLLACHADKRGWSAAAAVGTMASPRFIADASFYYESSSLTPAMVKARVAEDHARGVRLLKAYNNLPLAPYRTLAGEAQAQGMSLVGHVPKAVPLAEAVARGQRSFEHGRIFIEGCFANAARWRAGHYDKLPRPQLVAHMLGARDHAACEAIMADMAIRDVAFVPTLVTREEDARAHDAAYFRDSRLRYADPLSRWAFGDDAAATVAVYATDGDRALLAGVLRQAQADALAAHRAGIPVLVGSDTIIAGPKFHDEMGLLTDAGLTPAEVLRAATLDAARFAGLDRDYGSVTVGKHADLLLLDADPLADIDNSRRIAAVILGGHLYDRGGVAALLNFVRAQAAHPGNGMRLIWGFLTSPASADL